MELKLRENSILRRPWLIASIVVSILCMSVILTGFNYVDGCLTQSWSFQLLDCIFRKTTDEFYIYSESLMDFDCCDKTILMMLPVSLWNIPMWIINQVSTSDFATGFGGIIWMKIGYVLCLFVAAHESARIIKTVNPKADYLLVYPLLFGSFDIVDSIMYACQDEIVYLTMLIIALRHLIQGNKRLFLLFSAITVSLNPEMIIPVFLMILFCEKRIIRVLLFSLITYAPSAIVNLIYRNNVVYNKYNWLDRASDLMRELFTTDVGLSQSMGNISLFLVVVCLLLFFTYTKRLENQSPDEIIWIIAVAMTSMTLLSSGSFMNYFYRSFLYVPFLVLVVLSAKNNLHTNLILFLLYTWIRGWMDLLNAPIQNLSSAYLSFSNEFTRRVFDKSRIVSPGLFVSNKMPILSNYGVMSALCLALAIVIFYINHISNRDKEYVTFKPKKDILVFVTGLFVPGMVFLFNYSMLRSDIYSKKVFFGSEYIQEFADSAAGFDYTFNNCIYTFPHSIVYEDGICLDNGADEAGYRVIYPEGISYGPYIKLFEGEYRITVSGVNLNLVQFDCTYNDNGVVYPIPVNVITQDYDRIEYTICINGVTENIETRFINNSNDSIELYSVEVQEIN